MKKNKKTDRRRQILDAAVVCFKRSGVGQTRFADIAIEAGVDQPLIHYYFPNMDALFSAVVDIVLDLLMTITLESIEKGKNDPKAVLSHYVRAPFEFGRKHPGEFALWMYFYYLAAIHPTFSSQNKKIRDTGRNRIAVLIYTGLEKGVFRLPKGLTVQDLAFHIQGLISGNSILAATEDPKPWKDYEAQTVAMVMSLVGIPDSSSQK